MNPASRSLSPLALLSRQPQCQKLKADSNEQATKMDAANTPNETLYTTHHTYDDGASITSRYTAGSKRNVEELENYESETLPRVSIDNNATVEDEITAENLAAVSTDRQMIFQDNTTRLQSILENIKNATKTVLTEMNVYLGEMEGVEKTYIQCRAKTQREGRRLESVAPDVAGATQNFLNQAAGQMFAGAAGTDFAAMMNGAAGGGGVN